MILVFWLHFLGDFILQNDKMAINKSHHDGWLALHALTYGIPFLILGWRYALINALMHFAVDGVTSMCTAYLWKHEQRHWFFVVIGLDQAIHMTCLFLTLSLTR